MSGELPQDNGSVGELERLTAELRHGDRAARLRAMTFVQSLLPGGPRALPEIPPAIRDALITALIDLFADPDPSVAGTASLTLNRIGRRAVAALQGTASHPGAMARYLALGSLRHLDRRNAARYVLQALADPDEQVRWLGAGLAGKLRDPAIADLLGDLLQDPSARVRAAATSALRKRGALPPRPSLPPREGRYEFKLYADYSQFYVGDSAFEGDTGDPSFWSPEAFERRLAISPPSLLGIGTARYDYVPVVVEVNQTPPAADLDEWDHVVEASLMVPSGKVAIDGCTSYRPVASRYATGEYVSPHITVAPGTYRVRVYYGGLDTMDDDHYRLVFWPAEYAPPQVLRAHPQP